MNFEIDVNIMPHKGLLDPQGKAVHQGLNKFGITEITDVRIGKRIIVHLEANSEEEARELAEKACKNVLVNQVMETYEIEIKQLA